MENDEWKRFETNLVNQYQHDANAELAEALIKEYSAHIYKNTLCSKELETEPSSKIQQTKKKPKEYVSVETCFKS